PGQVSIALIQDEATNFIATTTYTAGDARIPGLLQSLGDDDPLHATYGLTTQANVNGVHRYRNMDLNYQQTLGFLQNEYLRGISLGVTYSRSMDNQRHINLVPRRWGFTPSYSFRRFNAGLGILYTANKPSS